MVDSADNFVLSLDRVLVTMENPELARTWLRLIREHAEVVRATQAKLARELEELDSALLVGSQYAPISDLATEAELSRPTVYKSIERAKTKALATKRDSDIYERRQVEELPAPVATECTECGAAADQVARGTHFNWCSHHGQ